MRPLEQKLMKVAESVTGAITEAGDTAFAIVSGQVAGIGADWIDKLFLTEEDKEKSKAKRVRSMKSAKSEKSTAKPEKSQERLQKTPAKSERAPEKSEKATAKSEAIEEQQEQSSASTKDDEALDRKSAKKMAEKLSKNVSIPEDLII